MDMPSLAAMVVVMTCKALDGSTQDVCSYTEPKTWVHVTAEELRECADAAQERNEFYEFLRSKKLNGSRHETARCEVVNMDAHDDSAPEKPHRTSYPNNMQSLREAQEHWTF